MKTAMKQVSLRMLWAVAEIPWNGNTECPDDSK